MDGDLLDFLVAFLGGGDQRLESIDRTGGLPLEHHVWKQRYQGHDQTEGRRQQSGRDTAGDILWIRQRRITTEEFEALDDSDDCPEDAQQRRGRDDGGHGHHEAIELAALHIDHFGRHRITGTIVIRRLATRPYGVLSSAMSC